MADKHVTIKNFKYIDAEIETQQGDRSSGPGSTTVFHGDLERRTVRQRGSGRRRSPFEFVFNDVGEFRYGCDHHGSEGQSDRGCGEALKSGRM
jgi:hypothetical protein